MSSPPGRGALGALGGTKSDAVQPTGDGGFLAAHPHGKTGECQKGHLEGVFRILFVTQDISADP